MMLRHKDTQHTTVSILGYIVSLSINTQLNGPNCETQPIMNSAYSWSVIEQSFVFFVMLSVFNLSVFILSVGILIDVLFGFAYKYYTWLKVFFISKHSSLLFQRKNDR